MATLLTPTSLILVAVMTDPRDLEIARAGLVPIPALGAQGGSGRLPGFTRPVLLAWKRTVSSTRARCAARDGDPRRIAWRSAGPPAPGEYYKIQLGPLERLPKPIPGR
jgi:hypothetical protein